jgi:hypothetical protein
MLSVGLITRLRLVGLILSYRESNEPLDEETVIDRVRDLHGIGGVARAFREQATAEDPPGSFGVKTAHVRKATAIRAAKRSTSKRSTARTATAKADDTQAAARPVDPVFRPVPRDVTKDESAQPIITSPDSAVAPSPLEERLREADERLRAAQDRVKELEVNRMKPIMEGEMESTPTIDDAMRQKLFKIAAPVFHPRSSEADVIAALRGFHRIAPGCTLDQLAE